MGYLLNDIRKVDKKEDFILDKSLRLFVKKGLLNVTLENISEECGYTLKEIKKYYSDISLIIDEPIKRATTTSNESTIGVLNARVPTKVKFKILVEGTMDGINKNYGLKEEFAFMLMIQMVEGQNSRVNSYSSTPNMVLAKIIEDGQRENIFIDGNPRHLSAMFWKFFQAMCVNLVRFEGDIEMPSSENICRILLK